MVEKARNSVAFSKLASIVGLQQHNTSLLPHHPLPKDSGNAAAMDSRIGDNKQSIQLPMLANQARTISSQRMKQIMSALSAPDQRQRLATDASFVRQQAAHVHDVTAHLRTLYFGKPQECRRLLEKEPQLLKQLVALATAALQQLAAQRDSEVEVSKTAALLADTLGWMLAMVRGRPSGDPVAPSTPADAAKLQMMKAAGGCLRGVGQAALAHTSPVC